MKAADVPIEANTIRFQFEKSRAEGSKKGKRKKGALPTRRIEKCKLHGRVTKRAGGNGNERSKT